MESIIYYLFSLIIDYLESIIHYLFSLWCQVFGIDLLCFILYLLCGVKYEHSDVEDDSEDEYGEDPVTCMKNNKISKIVYI